MKIYIAGTISDNNEEFKQAKQLLRKKGYVYYNAFKGLDLEELSKCDGILLLDYWTTNKDAIEAVAYAEQHNIKKYFGIDQIGRIS